MCSDDDKRTMSHLPGRAHRVEASRPRHTDSFSKRLSCYTRQHVSTLMHEFCLICLLSIFKGYC